ncbi:site-2 protease family protein [Candidatus Bathyarchaeota archaeon]|nr:site-2 protease family protein [Candidatus Bathyarchaeota archaeon]
MNNDPIITLFIFVTLWFIFYGIVKIKKLEKPGFQMNSFYAIYSSTRLNGFIEKIAKWNPRFWNVFGNLGIAMSIGQASFAAYILFRNLIRFIWTPETASPVQPLILGVTISWESIPWFLLAAGIVLLTHEISHGIQCYVEGVPIKSSAILVAIITFGGAVEPDEEAITNAKKMSKMRIFAAGSFINLVIGLSVIPILILFNSYLPIQFQLLFTWLYLISINLSIMNMLPIGPLDGGQMLRTATMNLKNGGLYEKAFTFGCLALICGNIMLSFVHFGFVQM